MGERRFDKRTKRLKVRTGIRAGVPARANAGTVSTWLEQLIAERGADTERPDAAPNEDSSAD
jgi:hypothetical protein